MRVKCPSWNKLSALLGEWNRYKWRDGPMSPSRAMEIAANIMAANNAKRQGNKMPKDWAKVHPSMPYQIMKTHDDIINEFAHKVNEVLEFDIE